MKLLIAFVCASVYLELVCGSNDADSYTSKFKYQPAMFLNFLGITLRHSIGSFLISDKLRQKVPFSDKKRSENKILFELTDDFHETSETLSYATNDGVDFHGILMFSQTVTVPLYVALIAAVLIGVLIGIPITYLTIKVYQLCQRRCRSGSDQYESLIDA